MGVSGGVIPLATDGVVVKGLDLARVFMEGADWVGGWEKRQIVDLEKSIDYGSDKEKIVVDTIGCVKEGEFYKRGGMSGSKVKDVDATGFFWVFLGCFLDQIRLE